MVLPLGERVPGVCVVVDETWEETWEELPARDQSGGRKDAVLVMMRPSGRCRSVGRRGKVKKIKVGSGDGQADPDRKEMGAKRTEAKEAGKEAGEQSGWCQAA